MWVRASLIQWCAFMYLVASRCGPVAPRLRHAKLSRTLQLYVTTRATDVDMSVEHGPFKINDDLTLDENPYGWDVSHNVIYVDQPIGSGYSYSTDPADTVYSEAGIYAYHWSPVVHSALL